MKKTYNWQIAEDNSECWCALQEIGEDGQDIVGGPAYLKCMKNISGDTISICLQYAFTSDLEEIDFIIGFSSWREIQEVAEERFDDILDAIS